jgi:ATP-dependent DNA helicase RecG
MATTKTIDTIAVTTLKGVGPRMAEKLARFSIQSVQDLLFHLPLRYQDRTKITAITALHAGADAVIQGVIKSTNVAYGRRRSLVVKIQDDSGLITLRFFHFSNAQKQGLADGSTLRCFGEARRGANGLELYHPEYQLIDHQRPPPLQQTLTPIYPSTEGFSQAAWRKLCGQALGLLTPGSVTSWFPEHLFPGTENHSLEQLLSYLHHPPANTSLAALREGLHPFQRRLAFEELLAHNLSLQKLRLQVQTHQAPCLNKNIGLVQQFLKQLPFSLTEAQQRVVAEIEADLSLSKPMLRLIQGDVGSGKTVVAAIAALHAISSGFQVVIMAPTEILAEQHFNNFKQWFEPLGISLAWLTGKLKVAQRREQLAAIANHEAQVILGTHALFQQEVHFAKLALVIIDEQHRFGVHQRLALKEKSQPAVDHPHQLIMTATPIPRTLAMSAYADLDTSVIDELPPGRKPINTVVIDNTRRQQIIDRVQQACAEGRQAYWVCTLIEESETLEAQAAEDSCAELTAALPELRIGLVHGRMKSDAKAAVMRAFKQGELNLLVATTVIEVGVDVPNASLMIIENAERLGLAQLHQLRGRVGRGTTASHCVLMYQSPMSANGKERLQAMRESGDGFYIAEKDLQLRGPGEVLGTRQTGLLQMRIADLQRDSDLLGAVKSAAHTLITNYPDRIDPLIQRWLPNKEQYLQA